MQHACLRSGLTNALKVPVFTDLSSRVVVPVSALLVTVLIWDFPVASVVNVMPTDLVWVTDQRAWSAVGVC